MLTSVGPAGSVVENTILDELKVGSVYTFVYLSQRGDVTSRTILMEEVDRTRELIGGLDYRANDYRSFNIDSILTPLIERTYVLSVNDARQLIGCALEFQYYACSGKVDERRSALVVDLNVKRMMLTAFDLDKRGYRKFAIEGIIDPYVLATPQ